MREQVYLCYYFHAFVYSIYFFILTPTWEAVTMNPVAGFNIVLPMLGPSNLPFSY